MYLSSTRAADGTPRSGASWWALRDLPRPSGTLVPTWTGSLGRTLCSCGSSLVRFSKYPGTIFLLFSIRHQLLLATKSLRILSLSVVDKIRNHLVANPIVELQPGGGLFVEIILSMMIIFLNIHLLEILYCYIYI